MKFPTLLSLTILALSISTTTACLQVSGVVATTGASSSLSVTTVDNGLTTCNSAWGWRIDQDNHFSLTCLANYVFAFTRDGTEAWYANPVNAFSFGQNPQITDRDGSFTQYTFQEDPFAC